MKNAQRFFAEYAKHSALNLGQCLQGVRYIYSHPDVDDVAARGTAKHLLGSLKIRVPRLMNDFWYALIPPHWHHTPEEIASLHAQSMERWFLCGYAAWRFEETGELKKTLMGNEDRRWDPRCRIPDTVRTYSKTQRS